MAPLATTTGSMALDRHGIEARGSVSWNLRTPAYYMQTLRREEGVLAHGGGLVVDTGKHTGRSAQDKFIVREPGSEARVWWSPGNRPIEEESFDRLRSKVASYLGEQDLYVVDAFAGADPEHRLAVRVVTPSAYHGLFARTMFLRTSDAERAVFEPDVLVLHAPGFEADPGEDATRTETFIALHLSRREVLIGGTHYAGEIKKAVFTMLNDAMPQQGVLPMHCSANIGPDGDVAVFFGLSGTGKTTLSADSVRRLIGDDEHGWGHAGVFNFERGCYAKVIRLSPEAEPEIYETTHTFGTLLENVVVDEDGVLDLDSAAKTENTRAAYTLSKISNSLPIKQAGHPSNVIFLTADAFGVMPPIARLSNAQARYHFLSGFTARLAGTEIGVTEPAPTFSPCFGGPFLPQPPPVYARMLGEKLAEHQPMIWLVNTGWTGGPAGGDGRRMPIAATRALLHAAMSGRLATGEFRVDEVFGFDVPVTVPGIDTRLLDPRSTWRDPAAYDRMARELAGLFRGNFEKLADVDPEIAAAGPQL